MKKALFALLFSSFIVAQPQSSPFRLSVDISRFRGDNTHSYVELYYSFDVSALKYLPAGDGHRAEVIVKAIIKRSSDDSIKGFQAWKIPFSVKDTTALKLSRIYSDIFAFMLAPDIYRVYMTANDEYDPTIKDSLSFVLDVNKFDESKLSLSDPELCSSIVPVQGKRDSNDRFYKNTFDVKANPSKIFGLHQPLLYYYLEAYGLNTLPGDSYAVKAVVTNAIGKDIINQEKPRKRVYESNVEVGMLRVHDLRTGAYTFTYEITDSSGNPKYSSAKRFFIYNPNLPMDTLVASGSNNVDASVFATMSEEELDKELQYIRYIETKTEKEQFEALQGINAKRRALLEFWKYRDEDQTTELNENREEYLRRVRYANDHFKAGYKDGWKTDRGRVYIVYGPYDEIERHANEGDVKPYEIWYYHSIQGGVEFVFGDRTGFSDYVLLHSTHRNEIQDPNWMYQLRAN